MLLVADAEGEVFRRHVALQDGVRAAQYGNFAGGERLFDRALFRRGRGAGEEGGGIFGEIALHEGEVLRGEHLRRREERRLMPASDRHEDAREGDRRFAAADVALQKPVHAGGRAQVFKDSPDRRLLPRREREGKAGGEVCHVLPGAGVGKGAGILFAALDEAEGGDEDEILLEGDAGGALFRLGERLGGVYLAVCLREGGKPVFVRELRRHDGLRRAGGKRGADGVAHAALGQRAFQPVHGDDAL